MALLVSARIQTMVDAYVTALLWSTHNDRAWDAEGQPVDGEPEFLNQTDRELSDGFEFEAYSDVRRFLDDAGPLLDDVDVDADASQIGHDIALTRNGHGAGFWDRPELYGDQDRADALSDLARQLGPVDPYIGDDGLIHYR